jgi:hypothetical protein
MYLNASLIDISSAAKQVAPITPAEHQGRRSLGADLLEEAYGRVKL